MGELTSLVVLAMLIAGLFIGWYARLTAARLRRGKLAVPPEDYFASYLPGPPPFYARLDAVEEIGGETTVTLTRWRQDYGGPMLPEKWRLTHAGWRSYPDGGGNTALLVHRWLDQALLRHSWANET